MLKDFNQHRLHFQKHFLLDKNKVLVKQEGEIRL